MERCEQFGHYDRRNPGCEACIYAAECRERLVECYGKAYSRSCNVCQACPLLAFCKDAGDIKFHTDRHGEPSVVATDNIEQIGANDD